MSKFEELDHRIGRHANAPNPKCPICDPSAVNAADEEQWRKKFWDYDDMAIPAFPDFGSFWRHKGEILTFVTPASSTRTDTKMVTGFWASPFTPVLDHNQPFMDTVLKSMHGALVVQMEMGSGKWHSRVRDMAVHYTLPAMSSISSPLGVDLPAMAKEQNVAKLVVNMSKNRLFPISEVLHRQSSEPATDLIRVVSTVLVVDIPDDGRSNQMTFPF